MAIKMKEVMGKVLNAGATVAGGIAFSTIDTQVNTIPFLSSNASINPNAASAKWMKTALYTGIGLAADILLDSDPDSMEGMAVDAVTHFAYGLAAATYAADPVINSFQPNYRSVASGQTGPIVQQRIVPTGNLMS